MFELSHILRVLLKRIPYQNFLNGQMNCRDLQREMVEHIVHTYMTEYSDTEVRNILDGISESWQDNYIGAHDNAISGTISVFEILFRFVEKILIWKNNEVRIRYEDILRWRATTQDLGEEFFVAAFVAMQDLRNGRYCRNFGWPFVIGHNNVQLRKITEKGMAENHFHLWGAAPYFQISWIWMMNHVGQVQNQTSLENMKKNPRLLWWSSGEESAEGDLKKSCLQAALIRLYLYSLLTEKEIEIGKYYIEWTKLVPWAKKLKGSIPEEIIKKRRYWSSLNVLTTPFDGYEEKFEYISGELRRYMFALENILRESEGWAEFLPDTEAPYIKLSDILCAMFEAKKKIRLRDCYRLLDTEEYRKLWKDITYKKVILYLNNYDIMRWHVDDIQRAINDISGNKKDYMLNYVQYSTVFDAKSNFYVEGERKFLYEIFRHIKKGDSSWNAQVYNLFYAYLVIKEGLRGEMVQSNDWLGFENFSVYQRRSGAFANEVFWEKLKARAAVTSCFEQKVRKLEIRLSPYDSARRNFQEICFLDEANKFVQYARTPVKFIVIDKMSKWIYYILLGLCIFGIAISTYVSTLDYKGCSLLFEKEGKVTLSTLSETLLELSSGFFWPMIEEIKYKIGVYEPLMDSCMNIAEIIYKECGEKKATTFIIHRNLANKFAKPLEILEYAGFISKREASRGMKKGGRGTRFAINLCNTLEKVAGTRLTRELYNEWKNPKVEDVQFSANSMFFSEIDLPEIDIDRNIGILELDIDKLKKSDVFPYGLTDDKLQRLKEHGYKKVGELAEATEGELKEIYMIGDKTVQRIRNVVEQAIWM